MEHLNFKLISSKVTKKLMFAVYKLEQQNVKRENFHFPRARVKGGKKRNNFSIILEKKK